MNVLLVDDEEKLGQIVSKVLSVKGINVRYFEYSLAAWRSFNESKPDVVVLDVMMPAMDGFTLAKKIREADQFIPIIFLTARTAEQDVLNGFQIGANDYLRKPFSIDELYARIYAVHRSHRTFHPNENITIGNYTLNPKKHTLKYIDEDAVVLPYRESELLRRLYERKNVVITRKEILFEFWKDKEDHATGRSLDVFICRLRKRLEKDDQVEIRGLRNVGYMMVVKNRE